MPHPNANETETTPSTMVSYSEIHSLEASEAESEAAIATSIKQQGGNKGGNERSFSAACCSNTYSNDNTTTIATSPSSVIRGQQSTTKRASRQGACGR
jgi:hypothetical protein